MKSIKKYKKVLWGIEHRKNCLLKSTNTIGVHLYETKKSAEFAIKFTGMDAIPVKVLVTIERPNVYG
jgi:hypothetical protein